MIWFEIFIMSISLIPLYYVINYFFENKLKYQWLYNEKFLKAVYLEEMQDVKYLISLYKLNKNISNEHQSIMNDSINISNNIMYELRTIFKEAFYDDNILAIHNVYYQQIYGTREHIAYREYRLDGFRKEILKCKKELEENLNTKH